MSKIFSGQTSLRIRVSTGIDITGATASLIKYKKPGGSTGSWTASVEAASTGVIYYDLSTALSVGTWTIWAHITQSDARVSIGEISTFRVYQEGGA